MARNFPAASQCYRLPRFPASLEPVSVPAPAFLEPCSCLIQPCLCPILTCSIPCPDSAPALHPLTDSNHDLDLACLQTLTLVLTHGLSPDLHFSAAFGLCLASTLGTCSGSSLQPPDLTAWNLEPDSNRNLGTRYSERAVRLEKSPGGKNIHN